MSRSSRLRKRSARWHDCRYKAADIARLGHQKAIKMQWVRHKGLELKNRAKPSAASVARSLLV